MKKTLKTLWKSCLLAMSLAVPLAFPAGATETDPASYILDPMPQWYSEGFTRGELNIARMMEDGFTRLEAVEVQNQMKDLLAVDPAYMAQEKANRAEQLFVRRDPMIIKALKTAIDSVKVRKFFESGFRPVPLQPGDFYVAFDMDETTLAQWYEAGSKGVHYRDLDKLPRDFLLRPPLVGPDYVTMTPGWDKAFLELAALPGCKGVLFFTAKEDRAAWSIIEHLTINDKPLLSFIKGVFTRNYLVRDNNNAEKLSKDLRIIDESLQHVVLVDQADAPNRIIGSQAGNVRDTPKFNADAYYAARDQKQALPVKLTHQLLPNVVEDLRETAFYCQQHKQPFIKAFYPYSLTAEGELLLLIRQGFSLSEAVTYLRQGGQDFFTPKFYVPPKP